MILQNVGSHSPYNVLLRKEWHRYNIEFFLKKRERKRVSGSGTAEAKQKHSLPNQTVERKDFFFDYQIVLLKTDTTNNKLKQKPEGVTAWKGQQKSNCNWDLN